MRGYKTVRHYWRAFASQRRPVHFLISRLLWRSGLCKFLTIDRGEYKIRFFPTSLSAAYYADPEARNHDEQLIKDYLKEGDWVIDVGANIGTLTLASCSIVGDRGKVLSIEPHPRTFKFLEQNIHINGFTNAKAVNIAVGGQPGEVLLTDLRSDDQNRIISTGGIPTRIQTLDNLVPSGVKIDFLKVDTEGFELFVFQGGKYTLERCQCIYFESFEEHFVKYGYTTRDLLEYLKGKGFKVFRVDIPKLVPLSDINHVSYRCENLLAVKDIRDFLRRTGYTLSSTEPRDNEDD